VFGFEVGEGLPHGRELIDHDFVIFGHFVEDDFLGAENGNK
jgi:hypothetical protein